MSSISDNKNTDDDGPSRAAADTEAKYEMTELAPNGVSPLASLAIQFAVPATPSEVKANTKCFLESYADWEEWEMPSEAVIESRRKLFDNFEAYFDEALHEKYIEKVVTGKK